MATTWSTTVQITVPGTSANVLFSGGTLTATASTNVGSSYPCTAVAGAIINNGDLKYWEGTPTALNGGGIDGIGLVNGSFVVVDSDYLGHASTDFGYYPQNGAWGVNNSFNTIQTATAGTPVGLAAAGGTKVWITTDGVTWNGGTALTQNPIGAIGGLDISLLGSGIYPALSLSNSSVQGSYTANFGATTFAYSTLFASLQVAGYTSFDSSSGDVLMSQAVM